MSDKLPRPQTTQPVMREFLPRGKVVQPTWSHELMKDYWG
jgi:hypothetical protein